MPKCVLVLTDEIKIFHENDKHDAYRSVTKCIWGQETEISIMDDNLFQSARSKFCTKTTNMMLRDLGPNVFGVRRPK